MHTFPSGKPHSGERNTDQTQARRLRYIGSQETTNLTARHNTRVNIQVRHPIREAACKSRFG